MLLVVEIDVIAQHCLGLYRRGTERLVASARSSEAVRQHSALGSPDQSQGRDDDEVHSGNHAGDNLGHEHLLLHLAWEMSVMVKG
jgi:hypothetical protein